MGTERITGARTALKTICVAALLAVVAASAARTDSPAAPWKPHNGGTPSSPARDPAPAQDQTSFSEPAVVPIPGNGTALCLADIDGDGRTDVVAGTSQRTVGVLMNRASGFAASAYVGLDAVPSCLAVLDTDRDGKDDIVAGAGTGVTVFSVSLASGVPSLKETRSLTAPANVTALAAADFDNDGFPDVAATCSGSTGSVAIFRGAENGLSEAAVLPVGALPTGIVAADLDGDAWPDLAVSQQSSSIGVLMNGHDGFAPYRRVPVGMVQYGIASSDLNGDGKVDLVTADNRKNGAQVLLGNGDGTFQTPVLYAVAPYASAVAAGDVSLDGVPDVVLISQANPDPSILTGNGDGTLQEPSFVQGFASCAALGLADMDLDGAQDIVVATTASTVEVFCNSTSVITGFTARRTEVPVDGAAFLDITLSRPAPEGGLDVALSSSDPGTVAVPSPVHFLTGACKASVPAVGLRPGTAQVTASLNGLSKALSITVRAGSGLRTDVNQDGVVDMRDVMAVMRVVNGIDPAW